ncbi:ferritin [Haloferula sargassicola]|uniref:Ferritin n=1 Tax=Haloferula sargassicola TaxID=490096 RepID=A0ABP9UKA5_9BACT
MSTTSVIDALQSQAEHERFASISYLALSLWCEAADYSGFAEFFKKQAAEEAEHTEKIHGHLLDRGVQPILGAVEAPRQQFSDLIDVAKYVVELEKANTRGIHGCYEAALEQRDYPSQVMLHWFIEEQVEEEAWTGKLLTLAQRANCAGAMATLDRHVPRIFAD